MPIAKEIYLGFGIATNCTLCRVIRLRTTRLTPDFHIECNGAKLEITLDLHSALQKFSNEGPPATAELWIDAICIYQHQYRTKFCGNLRFIPLFYDWVCFALLACCLLEPEMALTTLCLWHLFTHKSLFRLFRAG
jgi:Heterokaryon incompatibility protein (HET)